MAKLISHRRILFMIVLLSLAKAHAALPPTYHVGELTLSETSEYFQSNANYDRYSNKESLISDYYFKTLTNSLDAKYDLDSDMGVWSFGAGANVNYSDSRGPDVSGLGGTEKKRTNSQFSEAHFVLQKPLPIAMFRLIPELKGSLTFTSIDYNRINDLITNNYLDDVLTSDNCNTATAGSWIMGNFGHMRLYGYLGYQYRDDNRSSLLPYEAGALFQFHHFILAGEIDGYESLTNDKYSSTYAREVMTNRVDGGSFRYYSVNPSETEIRLSTGFEVNKDFVLTGGFANTLRGQETAYGQSVYINIAYSFDINSPGGHYNDDLKPQTESARKDELRRKTKKTPGNNGKPGFEPVLENYDESLFDSNP